MGARRCPIKCTPYPRAHDGGGRFGFPAGYLAHLPPPSCGAKGLRPAARAKRRGGGWRTKIRFHYVSRVSPASVCSFCIPEILIRPFIHGRTRARRDRGICRSNKRFRDHYDSVGGGRSEMLVTASTKAVVGACDDIITVNARARAKERKCV